jgi:hypothetical protein
VEEAATKAIARRLWQGRRQRWQGGEGGSIGSPVKVAAATAKASWMMTRRGRGEGVSGIGKGDGKAVAAVARRQRQFLAVLGIIDRQISFYT